MSPAVPAMPPVIRKSRRFIRYTVYGERSTVSRETAAANGKTANGKR
jgi:hypothetical protein